MQFNGRFYSVLLGRSGEWLDNRNGVYSWHQSFRLVFLRLASFNIDLHWAITNRTGVSHKFVMLLEIQWFSDICTTSETKTLKFQIRAGFELLSQGGAAPTNGSIFFNAPLLCVSVLRSPHHRGTSLLIQRVVQPGRIFTFYFHFPSLRLISDLLRSILRKVRTQQKVSWCTVCDLVF